MNTQKRHVETSRRDFLIGGALIGTAVATPILAAAATRPPAMVGRLDDLVPQRVSAWAMISASDIPIPQGEGAGDPVYDQLLTRHYASDVDLPVMVLVAYGGAQGGSTQLHRPETCYPAAGFRLTDEATTEMHVDGFPSIATRVLTARAPGRIEQILYWSRIGTDFPTGNLAQRWTVLRQTLVSGSPDGTLVRLSTVVSDRPAGLLALKRFAAALLQNAGPELRRLLIGAR